MDALERTDEIPPDIECLIGAAALLRRPVMLDQVLERGDHIDPAQPLLRIMRIAPDVQLRTEPCRLPKVLRQGRPPIIATLDGRYVLIDQIQNGIVHFGVGDLFETMPIAEFREQVGQTIVVRRDHRLSSGIGKIVVRPWILQTVHKYRRLLLHTVWMGVFVQAIGLASPIVTQIIIDRVVEYRAVDTLIMVLLFYGLGLGLGKVLNYYRTLHLSKTVVNIDVELMDRLVGHLLLLPLSWYTGRDIGAITARVRELDQIRGTLTSATITVVMEVFFSLFFAFVMICYSGVLAAIFLASIPFYVGSNLIFAPMTRKRVREKFRMSAESSGFFTEIIANIETIKAAAIEKRIRDQYGDRLAAVAQTTYKANEITALSSEVSSIISSITAVAIFAVGAQLAIHGDLTAGAFVAFNMLSVRLTQPVLRLVELWQSLQNVGTTMERLSDILGQKPEDGIYAQKSHVARLEGKIEFQNVNFRYGRGRRVIEGMNLTIPAGQVIGIIGLSGSGKSTIANMIPRFYPLESGRILVDGHNIATMDPAWLRRQIGISSTRQGLLNRSVRINIALHDPGMSLERVINAAKIAGAHEFIMNFAGEYDFKVGEKGNRLSSGQQQRLLLARVVAKNPRIIILDEATGAVDWQTEKTILTNLREFWAGCTVLVISHHFLTAETVDWIITIENGKIVENGRPDELLSQNGYYAQQYREQFKAAAKRDLRA